MRRGDRRRWASARSVADIGELTCAWLAGELRETPGHAGRPCPETLPHLDVLAAANRAGFVTENSQDAGPSWNAWVDGFITGRDLPRLTAIARSAGLTVRRLPTQARDEVMHWYSLRCPGVADELRRARFVRVADPQDGRVCVLWPVLEMFAEHKEESRWS